MKDLSFLYCKSYILYQSGTTIGREPTLGKKLALARHSARHPTLFFYALGLPCGSHSLQLIHLVLT
jgi:hypothetical protein